MSAFVVRETGKGIYPLRVAQILKSPAADVGYVYAKFDFMLAANISHHVSAIEMTFGTAQGGLRSSTAKLPRNINARSVGNAVHRVFVVTHQKMQLVQQVRR